MSALEAIGTVAIAVAILLVLLGGLFLAIYKGFGNDR
jgi:hypothetical protein